MTEQDDMENWNYATAASRGTIARRYPYNYQARSARRATTTGARPCQHQVTEENARGFYRSWQNFQLDGAEWRR